MVEDAGEHCGHLHHQKDGEGDADQQCRELRLVIDQQLEADAQNAAVFHCAAGGVGAVHQPPPRATNRATVS